MAFYRLGFNASAIIFLLVPLYLMSLWHTEPVWQWHGMMLWLVNGLSILAVVLFLVTLKFYDMKEFLGLRQISEHQTSVEDQEHFQLSPFHHYVRHPWYFLGIVILWARSSMDMMMLASVIAMSLYFIIGSRLEERKLVTYHGDIYRRYLQKVPGIFPLPWKYLRAGEKL